MAEIPGSGQPEEPNDAELFGNVTVTTEDLVPIINIARNAFLAAIQVGLPPTEAQVIQVETYKMLLASAAGLG